MSVDDTRTPLLSTKHSASPYGAVSDQPDLVQQTSRSVVRRGPTRVNVRPEDDEYEEEQSLLTTSDATATSQYLKEALEEKESCSTCNCNIQRIDCHTKSPFKLESIKKAKQIGRKVITKTVLRNLFHKAIVREVFIYLSVVSLLVSTSFSFVSIVQDTSEIRNENGTQNASNKESLKILKMFDCISFGVAVLGLLFTNFDLSLYLRHHGCRVLKRNCKFQELVQPGDEEKAECFNDSCACEGTCGKGCTTVMDIARIVVLETIFYPILLLNAFKVIIITTENYSGSKSDLTIHWITAISSCLSVIIFVYIQKTYIFFGIIRSVQTVKTGVNKKCEFIVIFFMYMCALMFLQLLMIIIIVGRFRQEYYTERHYRK